MNDTAVGSALQTRREPSPRPRDPPGLHTLAPARRAPPSALRPAPLVRQASCASHAGDTQSPAVSAQMCVSGAHIQIQDVQEWAQRQEVRLYRCPCRSKAYQPRLSVRVATAPRDTVHHHEKWLHQSRGYQFSALIFPVFLTLAVWRLETSMRVLKRSNCAQYNAITACFPGLPCGNVIELYV